MAWFGGYCSSPLVSRTDGVDTRLDRVPLSADGGRAGLDASRGVLGSGSGQGGAGQNGHDGAMHGVTDGNLCKD